MKRIRDFVKKHSKKIVGLAGLVVVGGAIGWGFLSYYLPGVTYDENKFYFLDRNLKGVGELYIADVNGTEKYYRWTPNNTIGWIEKTGDEKVEEIFTRYHPKNFEDAFDTQHIKNREPLYFPLFESGEKDMEEIREALQQHIPFKRILDKI